MSDFDQWLRSRLTLARRKVIEHSEYELLRDIRIRFDHMQKHRDDPKGINDAMLTGAILMLCLRRELKNEGCKVGGPDTAEEKS